MDFLEGGMIKELKNCLKSYIDNPEEEAHKAVLDQELVRILEYVEINKKV